MLRKVEAKERLDTSTARVFLVQRLFLLLAATGVGAFIAVMCGGEAWNHMSSFLNVWLPTVAALLGTAVAFYYSGR
jgi:uncharacterized membrane protein YjjP (DUF1212 family)